MIAVTDGTTSLVNSQRTDILNLLQEFVISKICPIKKNIWWGTSIVKYYGGVINLKSKPSYVANIHRDIRFFGDFPLML
jgi:hypothetical protein